MRSDETDAKAVLNEIHAAWSEGDIDGTLACYADDLIYVCDTGGISGAPLVITGKEQFRDFLLPVIETVESTSTVEHFQLRGQVAHAFISCVLSNRASGAKLVGTYTQVAKFRRGKITKMFEIHDVARMSAFWRLVLSEDSAPSAAIFKSRGKGGKRPTDWREQLPPSWPRQLRS